MGVIAEPAEKTNQQISAIVGVIAETPEKVAEGSCLKNFVFVFVLTSNIGTALVHFVQCFTSDIRMAITILAVMLLLLQEKQSAPNFPKNEHFLRLIRPRACACQEVRNIRFSEKFGVLCFLVTSILRFAHLPYCRRIFIH